MRKFQRRRFREAFAWLELLLVLAVLALVVQLIPGALDTIFYAINPAHWPRTVWFAINWGVLSLLVGVRFGPDLVAAWKQRRQKLAVEREQSAKQRELKEQRETLERIKRSRSRRLY
jgi:hypothetical protein